MNPFHLTTPLPARGSAEVLRQQLIDYLIRTSPTVGERFFSDYELTRVSKLSRPTVRRALDELQREGWIERRQGRGTFVGPRAAMLPLPDARHARHGAVSVGLPPESRIVRLAVMIHLLGELHHDWYARGVIAGIDDAAGELGVTIELLGHRDGDFKAVAQRLMQTRPDVLCLVAPSPARLMIINEARRLDIPCIGTGTFLTTLGIPTVHEDNAQGTQLAIDHLLAHGHERIGFVQMPYLIPWVFQRREGYLAAMQRAGLSADESLVCWLNQADPENDSETLLRFIERQKPTALLLGSHVAARPLGAVVRGGRIRVPRDLSLITFDQNPIATDWLGGVRPTCIALPVQQMGYQLARTAREIVQRQQVAATVVQPCELIAGETVKPM